MFICTPTPRALSLLFIIPNNFLLFLLTYTEIDKLNKSIPLLKFQQLNTREKREKDQYIGYIRVCLFKSVKF